MRLPQFHRRSRDEYAEVLANPNAVPQSDDSEFLVNMHPQGEEIGPFINLQTISRIEIRYYAKMPQVPGAISHYTLDFGESHPELATRMYILYSGQDKKLNISADPV